MWRDRVRVAGMALVVTLVATLVVALASPVALAGTVLRTGSYISGEKDEQTTFGAVEGVPAEVVAVDPSDSASYAITASGRVYAWGNNQQGQLGDGSYVSSPFKAVQVALPAGVRVVTMGENDNGAMFVDSTGHVWSTGANISGSQCVKGDRIDTPVQVPGIGHVIAVQGGGKHDLLLTSEGKVYGCGSNKGGMLGLGKSAKGAKAPTPIPGLPPIAEISAGGSDDAFRTASGQLYMAGNNSEGQCGVGTREPAIYTPEKLALEHVTQVSAGGDLSNGATLALVEGGVVYGWGNAEKGEVGNGRSGRNLLFDSPQLATALASLQVTQVATGGDGSFALTESGALYGFGSNTGGDLGLGAEGDVFAEAQLVEAGVSAIAATAQNTEDIHP